MTILDLIESEEGFRATPYLCPAGKWTVGIGRNLEARGISRGEWGAHFKAERPKGLTVAAMVEALKAHPLTHDEATEWLEHDVGGLTEELARRVGPWAILNPARRAVLVSMAFQMGVAGLLAFKGMFREILCGDFAQAGREMLDSKWAKHDTPERAKRHAVMMVTGVFATREVVG